MANYYNVTGWHTTGFNYFNRPLNRQVLESDEFESNRFQVNGIQVNRDDMAQITKINVPGSVKDRIGDQMNPPNSTGSQPLNGPWYEWETVDYIRLVRTGYPGDADFVDISGNMNDPWEMDGGGKKLWIGYYFVTGLEPQARNVTTLYLEFDYWTSLGGADELQIETGYKIRGHVSESEDSSSYNLAPESIGLLEPLHTTAHEIIQIPGASSATDEFLVSSTDLEQYTDVMNINAFVAQADSGQSVAFPAIRSVSDGGWIRLLEPAVQGGVEGDNTFFLYGYRAYDQKNASVQHNLSILYSAGQLELQDSYAIPSFYVDVVKTGGAYTSVTNKKFEIAPKISPTLAYPRKADYMFGQEVLYSTTTGAMNVQSISDITNRNVIIWAIATPSGCPYARFKGLAEHMYLYDQAVQGMTWLKKAVILQGAAGSMWNQLNNNFSQQTLDRAREENQIANEFSDARYVQDQAQWASDTTFAGINAVQSAGSATNLLSGGKETVDAAQMVANQGMKQWRMQTDRNAEMWSRHFREQSLSQAQNQLNAQIAKSLTQAPYAGFVPDLSRQAFTPNSFARYIVNVGAKDRERLRNYFLRYGYSGQYKPLTWETINVKKRVNYIVAEGVSLLHPKYPMRVVSECANLLQMGLFLWSERPNQAAFLDNPDN